MRPGCGTADPASHGAGHPRLARGSRALQTVGAGRPAKAEWEFTLAQCVAGLYRKAISGWQPALPRAENYEGSYCRVGTLSITTRLNSTPSGSFCRAGDLSLPAAGWEPALQLLIRESPRDRAAEPLDPLELAACLESMGVTDEVAVQRYGAPDVFALAEAALQILRQQEGSCLNKRPNHHSADDCFASDKHWPISHAARYCCWPLAVWC